MGFDQANTLRDWLGEVGRWQVAVGGWTPDCEANIRYALDAAMRRNQPAEIALWRQWLNGEVEFVRRLRAMGAPRCRALERQLHGKAVAV